MNFLSPVTTALVNSINGVAPPNVPKEVKCDVCNILLSSYVSFDLCLLFFNQNS